MPQRNPYLILGVDFGAPTDVARRRFAQVARRMRRSTDGQYTIEDLTWALNEIETIGTAAADSVSIFRVPANPVVLTPGGEGLFRPRPEPLPRKTEPGSDGAIDDLRIQAAIDLRHVLLVAHGVETANESVYQLGGT